MSSKLIGRSFVSLLLVLVTFTASLPDANAASIETLVMPGPVVEGHEALETDCDHCHSKFDRKSQRGLCLDCHEDITADLASSAGFHGKHPIASQAECATCHVEHKGRQADIVGLVPELFDHSFTDFSLNGQHQTTPCAGCHSRTARYREAQTECVGCHEQDEPHQGNLGTDCASCHAESNWSDSTFDHDEATDYPLTGKHIKVECSSCHVNESYEGTPTDCVSCHKLDDVHNGVRGTDCASCHSTNDWTSAEFDHLAETDFALLGKHEKLACANCHLTDMALKTPPTTCNGCHSTNDPHLGRNGDDCASCHNQNNWETTFDHKQETNFALVGSHAALNCSQCHKGALTDTLPTSCEKCHVQDDPHGTALGACDDCHNEDNWDTVPKFHHDLTRFSLLGSHRVTTCEQCHNGLKFADNNNSECVDCHEEDDIHKGSLGAKCVTCHSPVDWARWNFDHNTQTDYPLLDSHENLVCDSCHVPGRKKRPSTNCYSCHRQDDVHRTSFGTNCQRCHNTNKFNEVQMGRN